MRHLERWAKERFKPLAIFAQTIAVGADSICRLLLIARERGMEELSAGVDDKERLNALYSQPDDAFSRTMLSVLQIQQDRELENLECPESEIEAMVSQLLQTITGKIVGIVRGILGKTIKPEECARETEEYRQHLKWLNSLFTEDENDTKRTDQLFLIPEVIFTLRVLIPCWMEYGQTAGTLLELAKTGDIDAMKKLLRLDERFMEVPELRELFYARRNQLGGKGRELFALTLGQEPERAMTQQRIRNIGAALILQISDQIWLGMNIFREGIENTVIFPHMSENEIDHEKCRIKRTWGTVKTIVTVTTPDIRELFDAAAKDLTKDELAKDRFISETDHAFYTAIKREAGFWQSLAPVSLK